MSENETQHKTLLGLTARWTAAVRAMESKREDRLFNDPWAAVLAGEDGGSWIEGLPVEENNAISTILRTRFFDDFLLRVTHEHGMRQVVLIAAGLDTRTYRLAWPEQTRLFELDQPQVLEYKEQILTAAGAKPSCERQAIAVDLTGPWTTVLQEAGFDPQQPTAWLLEGFLIYLPPESGIRILDDITAQSAPGSWFGFDVMNSVFLTSQWTHSLIEAMEKAGVSWQGAMDDPQGLLAERGWKATVSQMGEDGLNFGRSPYPVLPPEIPGIPRYWLVTAQKQ
ncbi:MAG TPA: SAM-dependent methyltransferase [Ktedonobacteraceae bacterium]|nr:SAM-dependent methyltransferase [Ktedonobacteraceae bacterium]